MEIKIGDEVRLRGKRRKRHWKRIIEITKEGDMFRVEGFYRYFPIDEIFGIKKI